jgi:hypothetical protein
MAETLKIRAPARLSSAEKIRWKRAVDARLEAGKPLKAAEIDTLLDLIDARTRIDLLRASMMEHPDNHFLVGRISAQINVATGLARRLSQDLQLLWSEN